MSVFRNKYDVIIAPLLSDYHQLFDYTMSAWSYVTHTQAEKCSDDAVHMQRRLRRHRRLE